MRNHSSFVRRSLSAVVGTAMLLAFAGVAPMVVTAPHGRRRNAADTPVGSITLHVQSARSVNPGAGSCTRVIPSLKYKWLINVGRHRRPGNLGRPGHRQVPAVNGDGWQHRPGLRGQLPVALDP